VLYEAGGDNTLGNAYGAVQLYEEFQELEELLDVTSAALLRLFDLGLVQFVEATPDVGYTSGRLELPAMTRDQLAATLERERDSADGGPDELVFYDPTPEGEAVLRVAPPDRIPRVSGEVRRPWLE
jgi:hypothetical protein